MISDSDITTDLSKDAVCQTYAYRDTGKKYPDSSNANKNMLTLSELQTETCGKVDVLEEQLREMADEIRDLRKELLAPDDVQKLKFLSQQFKEVSELLVELKTNCVKCLTSTAPLILEIQETCCICKAHKSSRHCCKCQNHNKASTASPNPEHDHSDSENPESNLKLLCNTANKTQPFYFAKVPNETVPDEEYVSPKRHCRNSQDVETTATSASSNNGSKTSVYVKLPVINSKLDKVISQMVGNCKHKNITLTVVLESNQLFHINVSVLNTGKSLGCIYATECAINDAKRKHYFDNFLTFFVLNPQNTTDQRNKILNHSFEHKHSNN